VYHDF
jgi:hypothetical protein